MATNESAKDSRSVKCMKNYNIIILYCERVTVTWLFMPKNMCIQIAAVDFFVTGGAPPSSTKIDARTAADTIKSAHNSRNKAHA